MLAIPQSPSCLLTVDLGSYIPELQEGQASDRQGASGIHKGLAPWCGRCAQHCDQCTERAGPTAFGMMPHLSGEYSQSHPRGCPAARTQLLGSYPRDRSSQYKCCRLLQNPGLQQHKKRRWSCKKLFGSHWHPKILRPHTPTVPPHMKEQQSGHSWV